MLDHNADSSVFSEAGKDTHVRAGRNPCSRSYAAALYFNKTPQIQIQHTFRTR